MCPDQFPPDPIDPTGILDKFDEEEREENRLNIVLCFALFVSLCVIAWLVFR